MDNEEYGFLIRVRETKSNPEDWTGIYRSSSSGTEIWLRTWLNWYDMLRKQR